MVTIVDVKLHYSFNLGEVGSGQCVGALAGQDIGLGANVWLLGDRCFFRLASIHIWEGLTTSHSFMKNVYTAFSFDQNAVGFAALK